LAKRRNTLREQITGSFQGLFHVIRRRSSPNPGEGVFWALKDVSFEVKEGDVVGIIGRNGAGKSTLLKILSRITEPTAGSAEIHGRVASLLEVGTGFHGELTGRENIYLNGAILGMKSAEIKRKFDEIVAFSEVEDFIDTPVKHYSSGMYVRLAFAVAAHLEPEILIVDEVLAVGDAAFQRKCLGKMDDVAKEGRTIVFVSHSMASVEHLCQKAIVIDKGRLVFSGGSREAIDYYLHSSAGEGWATKGHSIDLRAHAGRPRKYRPILKRLELFTTQGRPLNGALEIGAPLSARVLFGLESPTIRFDVALAFDDYLGQRVFTASTVYQPDRPMVERMGDQVMVCDIPSLPLAPGEYRIKVFFTAGEKIDRVEDAARFTVAESDYYGTGKVPSDCVFVLPHRWHIGNGGAS
jgi:lipopolysaccharide transport system ATP-binding protein